MKRKKLKEKIDDVSDHMRWLGELLIENADDIDNKSDYLRKFELITDCLFANKENLKVIVEKSNYIAQELNKISLGSISYN